MNSLSHMLRHLLCVLVLWACGTNAQTWVEFARTSTAAAFLDQSTVQPDPSRVIGYFAWWRSDLAAQATVDGKPYSQHLSQYRVDCLTRGLQSQRRYYFSSSGAQVGSDGPSGEALPMPDSLGEVFVNTVCARAGR